MLQIKQETRSLSTHVSELWHKQRGKKETIFVSLYSQEEGNGEKTEIFIPLKSVTELLLAAAGLWLQRLSERVNLDGFTQMKHKNNTLGQNLEKFWPTTSPSDAHPRSNEERQKPTQIHRCWQHRNTTAPQLSPEPQICVLHYLTALEHPLTSQNLGRNIIKG